MNPFYADYIGTAKILAKDRGLCWDLVCDEQGKVSKDTRWNLSALVGMLPPPIYWLGQVGVEKNSFIKLNEIRQKNGKDAIAPQPMSTPWLDLYLAIVIHQLLVRKTKPLSAIKLAVPVRQLAPVAGVTPPWSVTPEQITQAYNAALLAGASGKIALDFVTMVRTVLDRQKLADTPVLARFCIAYPTGNSQAAQKQADELKIKQNRHYSKQGLRRSLAERKSTSKLPDERAFWELVRIIFTETPQSLSDAVRFAALKVQIIMGFRIGETVRLPLDWKRLHEYVDADGRPAGERGGVSRSLMIRYFAEKPEVDERSEGLSFYETTQHVPPMFEEALTEALDQVAKITTPLRDRLRQQVETGRIFPEYPENAIVPAWEMYVRITGNAFFSDASRPQDLIQRYRETFDLQILEEAKRLQLDCNLTPVIKYWTSPAQRHIPRRTSSGVPLSFNIDWWHTYVCIADVEQHIRKNRQTKLSHLTSTTTTNGAAVHPHDLIFLMPIRNLIEARNGGLLDPTLYSAIGRLEPHALNLSISGTGTNDILFERYGQSSEDRALRLTSHSLRHLQNTELFRLGVADTIITKKFGRRSVQQSYVYDHRSLAEELADIELPPEAEERLGDKASQVFKLIAANKTRGPVVDEFRRVQREYGEEAAFDYLSAEADGLHVTPYGLCMNSFTSDPCPKHLECFNGCLHLARTGVISEQENLERMRRRFEKVIAELTSLPEDRRTIGWRNQLSHARIRLENLVKALATDAGAQVFPEGKDLAQTIENKAGSTLIDSIKRQRPLDD